MKVVSMDGPPKRLLSYDELKSLKGIPFSRTHLWRLERDGKFPKRVPLGDNSIAWVEEEIDGYIAERMARR